MFMESGFKTGKREPLPPGDFIDFGICALSRPKALCSQNRVRSSQKLCQALPLAVAMSSLICELFEALLRCSWKPGFGTGKLEPLPPGDFARFWYL